jgi:myosin heavy subunit
MMDYLHEPNLLHNLSVRYNRDEIYTFTAYILIAINPYKSLNIYDEETMWKYHKKVGSDCSAPCWMFLLFLASNFFHFQGSSLPPHVFAVAERAYRQMIHAGRYHSQSIVCSGDSGSGKTESAKYVLRYLTTIASGGKKEQSVLEKRILEANPIMEAFGNAKTLRNNNSSRFGKFVRVHFSKEVKGEGAELRTYKSYVVGADITTYLLEKPRLTLQPQGERNFHIFYQVFPFGIPLGLLPIIMIFLCKSFAFSLSFSL